MSTRNVIAWRTWSLVLFSLSALLVPAALLVMDPVLRDYEAGAAMISLLGASVWVIAGVRVARSSVPAWWRTAAADASHDPEEAAHLAEAWPLPGAVLNRLLAIPGGDRELLHRRTADLERATATWSECSALRLGAVGSLLAALLAGALVAVSLDRPKAAQLLFLLSISMVGVASLASAIWAWFRGRTQKKSILEHLRRLDGTAGAERARLQAGPGAVA